MIRWTFIKTRNDLRIPYISKTIQLLGLLARKVSKTGIFAYRRATLRYVRHSIVEITTRSPPISNAAHVTRCTEDCLMFSLLDFLADLSTGVDHCHLKREYRKKKRVLEYKAGGSKYVNR